MRAGESTQEKGAKIYCFMRSSGNDHTVSWNAAYAVIKRQGSGMFKTSPEHASVMITEAVVKDPGTSPTVASSLVICSAGRHNQPPPPPLETPHLSATAPTTPRATATEPSGVLTLALLAAVLLCGCQAKQSSKPGTAATPLVTSCLGNFQMDELQQMVERCDEAIDQTPDQADLHRDRSLVLTLLGDQAVP